MIDKSNFFLKYIRLLFISLFFIVHISCAEQTHNPRSIVLDLVLEKLNTTHFDHKNIDDEFSKKLFKDYLENLDPSKVYFTEKDISYLKKYETSIDDELKERSFDYFKTVNKIIEQKINSITEIQNNILNGHFDFNKNEMYSIDLKNYTKNEEERKKRIKKQLKLMILKNIVLLARENKNNSFQQNLKKSIKKVKDNLEDQSFMLSKITEEKRFQIYINTITTLFDPHTQYLFPSVLDSFNAHISGEFEGIGATLQQTKEGIKIISVITGGPAWKQGELKENDLILFLNSKTIKEPLDVSNMDINKAISYIKGKKGTPVTLTVKHIDGSIKDITIIRDVVKLEDTFAQSAIINSNNQKIGYIKLPVFYERRANRIGRDSSVDIKNILTDLNKKNTDSLIFDLRGNGGGSLMEVAKMVGLFIKKGPVVQVKHKNSPSQVQMDNNKSISYDKPLIVLVDKFSASASEIFAAAIQDYKRGIIVGSKKTFGKGTVQELMYLDTYVRKIYNYKKPIGAFKITTQKFYRINGGATQLKGVTSDIILPGLYSNIKIGEIDQKNPIKWDEIEPANYKPINLNMNLTKLSQKSSKRIENNDFFQKIKKISLKLKESQNKTTVDLNYENFKKNYFKDDNILKETKTNTDINNVSATNNYKDIANVEKNKKFISDLKKDPYVKEATNILNDWIGSKNS